MILLVYIALSLPSLPPLLFRCNTMLNCWYNDPDQRPRFSSLVQDLSDMLEEEAGYFNLSRTLSWKKEPEQRSVASPAEPVLLTIEEGGKEGREGREGSEGREGEREGRRRGCGAGESCQ